MATLDPTRRISAELAMLQAELHELGQGLIRALYIAGFAIGGSLFFGAVVIASVLSR